jgi:alpha-tubulin suppressor-like RCC1 family protein
MTDAPVLRDGHHHPLKDGALRGSARGRPRRKLTLLEVFVVLRLSCVPSLVHLAAPWLLTGGAGVIALTASACIDLRSPDDDGKDDDDDEVLVAALSASPPSLDFGDRVNGVTARQAVQLTNVGAVATGALTAASEIPELADFTLDASACGSLDPGQSCALEVAFTPSGGPVLQRFTVTPEHGDALSIEVTGRGLGAGALSSDRIAIVFPAVEVGAQSAAELWVIRNDGEATVPALEVRAGPGGEAVLLTPTTCPPLAAAETCELQVTFAPTEPGTVETTVSASVGDIGVAIDVQGVGFVVADAVQASAGTRHTCATLGDGSVKCWGDNTSGQLGQDDLLPRGVGPDEMGDALRPIQLGAAAVQAEAGKGTTCARLVDALGQPSALKCWGDNSFGQLGQGDTDARGGAFGDMAALDPIPFTVGPSALDVGDGFACALFDDAVACWGKSNLGQLGLDQTAAIGDEPGEMAPLRTALLGDLVERGVTAGPLHACVLGVFGEVQCWGRNRGQLGVDAAATGAASVIGDASGEMAALESVPLGRPAVAVAAGALHTCALLDDGGVKCWGFNNAGQLGRDNLTAVDAADEVAALLPIPLGAAATAIAAGDAFSCALLSGGRVKCWGENGAGQLGIESQENMGDDAGEIEDLEGIELGTGRTAVAITAGDLHACAVLDDGALKCWGNNAGGQLGLGDTDNRGDEPGEMGDDLRAVDLGTFR